jgi:hypothetical protein
MHPAYVDISHFRAPYKNAYFGAVSDPLAPPVPEGELPANWAIEKRGAKYYWTYSGAEQIIRTLVGYRFIFIGGPTERVQVVPYSPQELAILAQPSPANQQARASLEAMNAARWVVERVIEGKVVFAPTWILDPTQSPELSAIPASDEQSVALAASTPAVAILVEPKKTLLAGLMRNPYALALGAAALLGGAFLLAKRSKRGRSSRPFTG